MQFKPLSKFNKSPCLDLMGVAEQIFEVSNDLRDGCHLDQFGEGSVGEDLHWGSKQRGEKNRQKNDKNVISYGNLLNFQWEGTFPNSAHVNNVSCITIEPSIKMLLLLC